MSTFAPIPHTTYGTRAEFGLKELNEDRGEWAACMVVYTIHAPDPTGQTVVTMAAGYGSTMKQQRSYARMAINNLRRRGIYGIPGTALPWVQVND